MNRLSFLALVGILVSCCASLYAAGYKAGDAEPVKSWASRDYEGAKTAGLPLCIYIYDAANNNNSRAKLFEGPDLLANAEVKSKLKSFLLLKLKTDGSDVKGWPADILAHAGKGCAVMLANSDMSNMVFIDKDMQASDIKPAPFLSHIAQVLKSEEKAKKAGPKEDEKKKMPPPPEEKKGLPGLALDDKDKKKDEKKPPEKKKPAAPADE